MTSYLIKAGPFPFAAPEIRAELGLHTDKLDKVIQTVIAVVCLNSKMPVRTETWALSMDEDINRLGQVNIVGTQAFMGRECRVCEYPPNGFAVEAAHLRILSRCKLEPDIQLTLMRQAAPTHVMSHVLDLDAAADAADASLDRKARP